MRVCCDIRICDRKAVAGLLSERTVVIDYGAGSNRIDNRFFPVDKRIPESMRQWWNWKPDRVDAIVAYSVIEHMTPQEVYDFLRQSYKILKVGGVLLIHTMIGDKPHFWNNLSHQRPYPPDAIINFLTKNECEDNEALNFIPERIYYECRGFPGRKYIEDFSNYLACYLGFRREDYLMVLKKGEPNAKD